MWDYQHVWRAFKRSRAEDGNLLLPAAFAIYITVLNNVELSAVHTRPNLQRSCFKRDTVMYKVMKTEEDMEMYFKFLLHPWKSSDGQQCNINWIRVHLTLLFDLTSLSLNLCWIIGFQSLITVPLEELCDTSSEVLYFSFFLQSIVCKLSYCHISFCRSTSSQSLPSQTPSPRVSWQSSKSKSQVSWSATGYRSTSSPPMTSLWLRSTPPWM